MLDSFRKMNEMAFELACAVLIALVLNYGQW
jgi:hypothetical protein